VVGGGLEALQSVSKSFWHPLIGYGQGQAILIPAVIVAR